MHTGGYDSMNAIYTGRHEITGDAVRHESPLMIEIHYCEDKYGSIMKTPKDDPHFQKASQIAQGDVPSSPILTRRSADDDQIWTLWRSGMSYAAISRKLNIAYSTTVTHINRRRMGEASPARRYVDHAKVVRLYRTFRSERRVAEELGFSKTAIHKHILRAIADGEIVEMQKH